MVNAAGPGGTRRHPLSRRHGSGQSPVGLGAFSEPAAPGAGRDGGFWHGSGSSRCGPGAAFDPAGQCRGLPAGIGAGGPRWSTGPMLGVVRRRRSGQPGLGDAGGEPAAERRRAPAGEGATRTGPASAATDGGRGRGAGLP